MPEGTHLHLALSITNGTYMKISICTWLTILFLEIRLKFLRYEQFGLPSIQAFASLATPSLW